MTMKRHMRDIAGQGIRLTTCTVMMALALCALLAVPFSADAIDWITTGSTRNFETLATAPAASVAYQLPTQSQTTSEGAVLPPKFDKDVEIQQYVDGIWVRYATKEVTEPSGVVNLFEGVKKEFAGSYRFRLVAGGGRSISSEINVTVKKAPTVFNIGADTHTGKFASTDYRYSENKLHYQVNKEISVTGLGASDETGATAYLQRNDGGSWVTVGEAVKDSPKSIEKLTFEIRQETPSPKQYRFYVPDASYVTGGTSSVFTVSGERQTPTLSVRYSGKQRYRKTGMKLVVSTGKAYTGRATVYDGGKRIKNISVRYGEGVGSLPKSLKKGMHRIKVVFTPTEEFAGFYREVASAVRLVRATA
ncbi:MAG: hypothetical protein LBD12_03920 [Clostridiales Family XIII bacterium]|nr:hypothetical protein [Clostridiales Family XIII bacterium]